MILQKARQSGRRKKLALQPRRGRRLNAPWQPLAALVGLAGILWFAAAPQPEAVDGGRALVLRGNGAAAPSGNRAVVRQMEGVSATGGNGAFVLCGRASQENCVIDGDTIRYRGIKIRLADIDAPETHEPKCASEAARGRRATLRLLQLINAGPFELVSDGQDEDRYGRKLRVIAREGRSVGDTLVAEGLARRWDGARRSWCG